MTPFLRIVSVGMLALSATAAHAAEPPVPDDSARCQVWQRELSFAASVATHDPVAFAEHLHARTAFGVGRKPTVGREAVAAEWQGIIDGSALKLEWYPDVVTIGGDGDTAFSSGPSLRQDPSTGEFRHSRFGSVWQRDADGQWRVVFDDGTRSEPADAAWVKAFREGRRAACPPA